MLRALFVSFALVSAARAQFTVVSAASYKAVVAPDSLAAMFGSNLARSTASATLDAGGNLPTELASTRVDVNGTTAALIFVSPGQINFIVPAGTAPGAVSVTLRSTDTNTTRTASVQVASSAPALFTSDASGTGPGAILNALTFSPAPFLTVTTENGSDQRTRLAVYGTGFRGAKNVTATAINSIGNRYDLVIEFAGPAPGFAGLDQLNFVVPAALDGSGAVSLTVTTEDAVSNTVTFQMNLLPVNLLQLAGIALAPAVVNGGDTITATLLLNGIARTGGFPVSLRSSNLAAQPPGFATVPLGTASLDVPIPTSSVVSVQTGAITAQASNVSLSANFEIDPQSQVQIASFSVTPISTLGGRTLQGVIALTAAAPAGGIIVQIASDSASAQPPAAVVVPFAQTSVTFSIPTRAVGSSQPITFTATFNRTSLTSNITLMPLFTLALNPATVVGGATVTGSITLADPAPVGGATITLISTDSASARVPAFVTIPAGQSFNTFNIITPPVTGGRTVNISAMYQGLTAVITLTVNAPPAPTLSSLTISPDHITGGQSTQGTVTLAGPAPAGGIFVNLSSSALNIAQVPPSVIVQQGFTTAIFSITTTRVPVPETAAITATAGNITRTAVLTVQ